MKEKKRERKEKNYIFINLHIIFIYKELNIQS